MEYFELLNPDGSLRGEVKERNAVHRDGDLHGSAHTWIIRFTADGKIEALLQKRCETKDSFPGCLDISSAGHMDAGETFRSTALRELEEELGIKIPDEKLIYLFTQQVDVKLEFHGKPFWNREINEVYVVDPTYPLGELRYQESEISALIWQDAEMVQKAADARDPAYCVPPEEFRRMIACCKEKFER